MPEGRSKMSAGNKGKNPSPMEANFTILKQNN